MPSRRAFDYYCVLHSDVYDVDNELANLQGNGLTQESFREFTRDGKLANGKCTLTSLTLVWVACNSTLLQTRTITAEVRDKEGTDPTPQPNPHANPHPHPTPTQVRDKEGLDNVRFMSRHEFFEAVLRIAAEWHKEEVVAGRMTMGEAVARLCAHLGEVLPPEARHDSDAFRNKYCHCEGTFHHLLSLPLTLSLAFSRLLAGFATARAPTASCSSTRRACATSLSSTRAPTTTRAPSTRAGRRCRSVSIFMQPNPDPNPNPNPNPNLTVTLTDPPGEWITFVHHIALFECGQLSVFGAKLVYKWSRLRGQSSLANRAIDLHRNLRFEDFCEAVVRLAACVALPSIAELREAHTADAGEFLRALKGDPVAMNEFVTANKTGWHREPRQRVWDCVGHLMAYILRTVEDSTSRVMHGPADFLIDDEEAAEFFERRKGGAIVAPSASSSAMMDGVAASRAFVRRKLLAVLQTVDTFKGLSEAQLVALRDAMVLEEWKKGAYVIEQDAEGEEFYVIVEGSAHALKVDGKRQLHKVNELGEGDYFGELALLERQRRLACVRAHSAVLMTMALTKAAFEEVIGGRFSDFFAFGGADRSLGLRWESLGHARPEHGAEFAHEALAEALAAGTLEFTPEELEALAVYNLRSARAYIKAGDEYFRPVAGG